MQHKCMHCFLASESTSSNVTVRNAKILSTSFGSGTGDEGYSNTTSKDKTEILGM